MKRTAQFEQTLPDHAFRSIGLPDAEILLVKSELQSAIKQAIADHGWTQKQASEKLGWGQPDISKILNDRFMQHSVDRLLRAAFDLGLSVQFGVSRPVGKSEAGRVVRLSRKTAPSAARSKKPASATQVRRTARSRHPQVASSHAAE